MVDTLNGTTLWNCTQCRFTDPVFSPDGLTALINVNDTSEGLAAVVARTGHVLWTLHNVTDVLTFVASDFVVAATPSTWLRDLRSMEWCDVDTADVRVAHT